MSKILATASALAISAALAGCATQAEYPVDRPGDPAPSAVGGEPAPRAIPSQPIQSGALPPTGPRDPAPTATELPPIQSYEPPPPPPPPPPEPPRMVMSRPAGSGKVVNDAPPPVKVAKGDTLIGISRKTGVTVEALAKLNDLTKPYALRAGQTIKLPSRRYYTVESGDTLFAVARRFTLPAADLAEFNEFTTDAPIRRGQKLYLPPEAKDKGAPKPVPVPAPAPKPTPPRPTPPNPVPVWTPPPAPRPEPTPRFEPAPQPRYEPQPQPQPQPPPQPRPQPQPRPEPTPPPTPRTPQPYRPSAGAPPAYTPSTPSTPGRPQIIDTTAPLSDAQIAAAGRGKFVWPVRGDVLSRFGPTGGGQRNDGVNIAAGVAEGVRSAAAGEVVYAGNQVPGFGNLVLIKHEGGWVTAYAHLSNIDVKMRQAISQGQVIGQAGQTGSVDRPQLHFEIRYAPTPKDKARPIDPMLVLPR